MWLLLPISTFGQFSDTLYCYQNATYHNELIAMIDLDNDGLLDWLLPNGWRKNLGDFTFDEALSLTDQSYTFNTFRPVDFNQDGVVDLLADYDAGNSAVTALLTNDGSQNFSISVEFVGEIDAYVDFDDDGQKDIITSATSLVPGPAADTTSIYFHRRNGTIFEEAVELLSATEVSYLRFIDVDSDDDLDIIFGKNNYINYLLSMTVYENDGMVFTPSSPTYVGEWPSWPQIGHFDSDTQVDIAWITTQGVQEIYVSTSLGLDGEGTLQTFPSPLPSSFLYTGNTSFIDMNGDNLRDFLTWSDDSLRIFENFLGGGFVQTYVHGFDSGLAVKKIQDFSDDGSPDLLVEDYGRQIFKLAVLDTEGSLDWHLLASDPIGKMLDLKARDFDEDGDLDLVVLAKSSGLAVFENTGDTFAHPRVLTDRPDCVAFGCIDANGDGKEEFYLLDSNYPYRIHRFHKDENWDLVQDTSYLIEAAYTDISAIDVDNDGLKDLVLTKENAAEILYNGGQGHPEQPVSACENLTSGHSIAFYDWDADGDTDQLGLRQVGLSSQLFLCENVGNRAFAEQISLGSFEGTQMALADLDGDGQVDMANHSLDRLAVYLNMDTILAISQTFQNLDADPQARVLFWDYDHDGDIDITLDKLVFLNDGLGLFTQKSETFDALETAEEVLTIDVLGDEQVELLCLKADELNILQAIPATATEEIQSQDNIIKIVPNPTNGQVTIALEISVPAEGFLCISDLQGRLVESIPIRGKQVSISLNHLDSGAYLAQYYPKTGTFSIAQLLILDQ